MIILGIDPAYSKPIHVARFVDGKFADFQCVKYPYSEQPVMFFDSFKRIFRDALCDVSCPTCKWKGRQDQLVEDADARDGACPQCGYWHGMDIQEGGALVAIEKPVFIKINYQSFIKLFEVYVALTTMMMYEGISYVQFAPSSWRKVHGFKQGPGIKSPELKIQAVDRVEILQGGRRFLGPFSEQADMCESYLIGLAAMTTKKKTVTI